MKNNYVKQLLKLTATVLACAIIYTGSTLPAPSVPNGTVDEQGIETTGNEGCNDEEPGISPLNDKDYDDIIEIIK